MNLTPREISFLKDLRRTKALSRRDVQQLLMPGDADGSVARDFLRAQCAKGRAKKFGPTNEFSIQVAPIYHPTHEGCALLATAVNDMRWLLDAPPRIVPQDVPHALCRSRLIIDLDKAVNAQTYVQMPGLFTELCVVNPNAPKDQHIRIHAQVNKPGERNIYCFPDMVSLIGVGPYQTCYAWEIEMGPSGPGKAAARKHQGYFGLNRTGIYRNWFPTAQALRVIVACPGSSFRDTMREAVSHHPGNELWLFVDRNDLKIETMLHASIFYTCGARGPRPLVKPPEGWAPPPPPPAKAEVEVRR